MIDDPIEIDAPGCPTHRDIISSSGVKDTFFIRHNSVSGGSRCLVYTMMGDGESFERNVHFSIIRSELNPPTFYIKTNIDEVDRERLTDFVSTFYPDHFEWLLFHPEWLQ